CLSACRRRAGATQGSAPFGPRRAGRAAPQKRQHHKAAPEHLGVGRLQVPPRRSFYRRPPQEVQHHRHPDPRRVDSSPSAGGPHAQQANEAADAGEVHHLHCDGGRRPQDGHAKAAGAWEGVYVVQGVVGSHHSRGGQDLLQGLRAHARARRQQGRGVVRAQLW
ncbi:unnamed protein product, partial [Ascophyllum nodosum]